MVWCGSFYHCDWLLCCCVVFACLRVCVFVRCLSLFVVRCSLACLGAVCRVLCVFVGVILSFFVCSSAFVRSFVGLFACFLSRLVVCFPAELLTYS